MPKSARVVTPRRSRSSATAWLCCQKLVHLKAFVFSVPYYGILILFRTGKFWARVYDLEKPLNVVLASRLCNQKRGDRDIHKKKMIVSTKESHVSTSP